MVLASRQGDLDGDGKFDWKDAILDALLVGAQATFAAALGMIATGHYIFSDSNCLQTLFVTFGASFVGWLATKRGLAKKTESDA